MVPYSTPVPTVTSSKDALFQRHPEILRKLTAEAPTMLWPLLDGLLWRSRLSVNGLRRVNFYIKHLIGVLWELTFYIFWGTTNS